MNKVLKKPAVAIDIDGTLGEYHEHFLRFAEGFLGRTFAPYATQQPLWRHMRVSKQTYRAVKLAYRQGGMKRSMPVYPFARELTVQLRKAGAAVWITTTRPYLRLDNIDPDTRHWLKRHGIQHDGVIYGERKYKELVEIVGPNKVVAVLDDLPEMTEQAQRLGLCAFLLSKPYNDFPHAPCSLRVQNLEEACGEILTVMGAL